MRLDSIESTGAYKPEELLPEAIKIMLSKVSNIESCMRTRFPGLVPEYTKAAGPMVIDAEEAAANDQTTTAEGKPARKSKKSKA